MRKQSFTYGMNLCFEKVRCEKRCFDECKFDGEKVKNTLAADVL